MRITNACRFRRIHLLRFVQSNIGREYGTIDIAGHTGDRRAAAVFFVLVRCFRRWRVCSVADHETGQQFRRNGPGKSESTGFRRPAGARVVAEAYF